ncbi:MAG: GLPGLI family protein [Gemmatimonadaceae bacterium]|nr:GLPGLI family protein [Chitinophagaceae bacterium]
MKINYIICAFLLMFSGPLLAQQQFLSKGRIEYERKINVHRQFENEDGDEWFKEYISKVPKFHNSVFRLSFEGTKTSYRQVGEMDTKTDSWVIGPSKENIIVTDLDKQLQQSMKKVYEDSYLVQDSIRKMEWKLEAETRVIAGFECKKAVGRICDSVYVVAFYTEEILVNGGPESFSGLPGMILGLAIPRLYTTWFATKVDLVDSPPNEFNAPTKGKKITADGLQSMLKKSLKDWGKQGQRNVWWVML